MLLFPLIRKKHDFLHSCFTPASAVLKFLTHIVLVMLTVLSISSKASLSCDIYNVVSSGNIEKLKEILKRNPHIAKKRDQYGKTLLHAAPSREIAEILITQGAHVNAEDKEGETPLFFAAKIGSKDLVDLLVVKGAEVNIKSIKGWTPLHYAAVDGRLEVVELLVSKGSRVNAQDNAGWTPLHWASMRGLGITGIPHDIVLSNYIKIVEFLIQNGADVTVKDNDGVTPLKIAQRFGGKEIEAVLRAHGATE